MFRTGVSALILNEADELLLVNLESFEEQYFAVPGGGLEPQESREDAVYREVFEELGIPKEWLALVSTSGDPVRFLFKQAVLERDGKEYTGQERYFFGFRFMGDAAKVHPKEGEVRKHEWVSIAALKDCLLFDNQFEDTTAKLTELFPGLAARVQKEAR